MAKKAKELAIHDKDTGSSEVQVAQLTDKIENLSKHIKQFKNCLLYTSPSPRDGLLSRMPSSA